MSDCSRRSSAKFHVDATVRFLAIANFLEREGVNSPSQTRVNNPSQVSAHRRRGRHRRESTVVRNGVKRMEQVGKETVRQSVVCSSRDKSLKSVT